MLHQTKISLVSRMSVCGLFVSCNCLFASVYYVAPAGSDSRTPAQAQNINTPWLTINHAAGQVVPGDTVRVRGGIYYESVVMQADGVTWQAYPGETPIIDGSVPLANLQPLADANDFVDHDGVPISGRFFGNVNWQNIYKVTYSQTQTAMNSTQMLIEDGHVLADSSLPEQVHDIFDDDSTFIPVDSSCYGQAAVVKANRSEPKDYWNGTKILVYVAANNNNISARTITGWDPATRTFTLSSPLPANLSSGDRYKLQNHWGCLTRPGEVYYTTRPRNGMHTAYIWPRDPNRLSAIRIAQRTTGWDIPVGPDDDITVDGFTIRNFCGPDADTSFAIGTQLSFTQTAENLTIRNCTIYNIQGKYAMSLCNVVNCLVENCTVNYARTGWGIFTRGYPGTARCRDVIIRNCAVDWCEGTNYKFTETDYAQVQQCRVGRSSTHGNGIAVYENCTNIGIFHCQFLHSSIGIAYQDCTDFYVIGNDMQTTRYSMAHWLDSTNGTMIFLNNTMALAPGVSDLYYGAGFQFLDDYSPGRYIVKNNIFWSTALSLPSGYTTPPNTFEREHNCYLQTVEHWPPGPGSFESSPLWLFTDWNHPTVRDLTIKNTSAAIYHAGINVDDWIALVESVFAARGSRYAYDLNVDRNGMPWGPSPSIGAYERDGGPVEPTDIYNASQQKYYYTIQHAINDASHLDRIYVQPGTYYEQLNFRGKSIVVRGADPNNRTVVDSTIIDADGFGRAVRFSGGEDPNTRLLGLTVTGGHARGADPNGGGIFCFKASPTIEKCHIRNNAADLDGGGLYAIHSTPRVLNCVFSENTAGGSGGAMVVDANSTATVLWSTFAANQAAFRGGGLLNDANSCTIVTGCVFFDNHSETDGGGVFNDVNSLPDFLNCTLTANTAMRYGGGMVNMRTDPNIINSIIWGNTAGLEANEIYNDRAMPQIRCSVINGCGDSGTWNAHFGIDGGGNLDTDPLLAVFAGADNTYGTADDQVRLSPDSPCIDRGDDGARPRGPTDLYGRRRLVEGWREYIDPNFVWPSVDIGASEYACEGNLDDYAKITLADWALFAEYWMQVKCGYCGGADFNGDAAVTADDLLILSDNWLCGMKYD